ncbi:MAG TPA: hypothetical protein VEJ63_17115 [Planctomycetota bacterium]|nr:hypothetical protein [Planctomycetota bacterium]
MTMTDCENDGDDRDVIRDRMPRLLECVHEMARDLAASDETGRELTHHLGAAITAAYRMRVEASLNLVALEDEREG